MCRSGESYGELLQNRTIYCTEIEQKIFFLVFRVKNNDNKYICRL